MSETELTRALREADLKRIDDLRAADQRAVELLAGAQAARISTTLVVISILIAIASLLFSVYVGLHH